MATVFESYGEPGKHLPPAANDGDDGYRPHADEPFMGPRQLEYFREKLLAWKDAIYREAAGTLNQLQADSLREADLTDRASSETDWSIELRTRAKVTGLDDAKFQELAQAAKTGCPVSQALTGVDIKLDATLE